MSSILSQEERGRILHRILFCPAEERTARELLSLQKSERQQVWADMAGYAAAIDYRMHAESPELLRNRLSLLESQLQNMSGAHRLAIEQDPDWVDQQKIKFLRAEGFDAAAAAARMVRYFALKQSLFGNELLGRDILLTDLNEDDMKTLRAGGVQILSEPDHAGRRIFFSQTRNYLYKERANLVCNSGIFRRNYVTLRYVADGWFSVCPSINQSRHEFSSDTFLYLCWLSAPSLFLLFTVRNS